MEGVLRHCTGGSDQDHPQEKQMQKRRNGCLTRMGSIQAAATRGLVESAGPQRRPQDSPPAAPRLPRAGRPRWTVALRASEAKA